MRDGDQGKETHLAFRSLVAPGRSSRGCGQQGAVLLFVLTIVLVLTIGVAAILAASLNSQSVATKLEDSTKSQHRVDGALEEAVNQIRNDTTICSTTAQLPVTVDSKSFTVACDPVTTAEPASRVYDLSVTKPSDSTVLGLSQVKVIDWPSLGYKLEVCDWLLGRNVSVPLNSCPTAVTP